MAKPRVFISSTYYDLKYVRSSLELFVESLGYDAILSEKGDIAYMSNTPLDESCYREVLTADMYVLMIGGRYGSEASERKAVDSDINEKAFYRRYESITKKEYEAAVEKDSPIFILIEKSVYAEFQTFRRNKDKKKLNYAHVDSVNVFFFIEEILAKPRNNPIFTFERYAEIEDWLRSQWAGIFREYLHRSSSQQQLATLSARVAELGEINQTLKTYLETVIRKSIPKDAEQIISAEDERLRDERLLNNDFVVYAMHRGMLLSDIKELLRSSESSETFNSRWKAHVINLGAREAVSSLFDHSSGVPKADVNAARKILGLQPLFDNAGQNERDSAQRWSNSSRVNILGGVPRRTSKAAMVDTSGSLGTTNIAEDVSAADSSNGS